MYKTSEDTVLTDVIYKAATYSGLTGYTIEMYNNCGSPDIIVKLEKRFGISTNNVDKLWYEELMKFLFGSIESSPLVKDITSELSNKIEQLTKENDTLKTEVASLKPYKTYYDLHMDLTHGKK